MLNKVLSTKDRQKQFDQWRYDNNLKQKKKFDQLTHQDVLSLMKEAEKSQLVDFNQLVDFLHHREVAYDLFLLVDNANRNRLRKFIKDKDGNL